MPKEETMGWLAETIYGIAENHFHRWYGYVSAAFLSLVVALIIYGFIPENVVPFVPYISVVVVLDLILFFVWLRYAYSFPKRSDERLGVVIAVHVEELEDSKFFKNDFLTPFKTKISESNLPFDVLVLKNHQAEKVVSLEDARNVLERTKAHFCVWGSVKKRGNDSKGQKYWFSLRGVVVHSPIKEAQRVLLRKEFDALLPNKVAFEENLQFEGFEFRSNQLVTALNYITGRAALLSGDSDTAIRLHEPLFVAIQNGQSCPIPEKTIRELLAIEYDHKAATEFLLNKSIEEYEKSIEKALFYSSDNYGALLKKAIVEFNNGRGDARIALRTIERAKQFAKSGYHWLYSKAFLHFWLEEYEKAIKTCDKLKEKNYEGEERTVQEVIKFNEDLVKIYEKPQLYYWLGFVSYVKGGNASFADQWFQDFLDKAGDSMQDLHTRAQSYLSEIRKEIGYTP